MPKRKPSATVQLKIRMRETLRGQIEQAARENERTMNDEVEKRLEESFRLADTEQLMMRIVDHAIARWKQKEPLPGSWLRKSK